MTGSEPVTVGQMFDAMYLMNVPEEELGLGVIAYFMPGDCLGSIWWQDGSWYASDIGKPIASKFDRFEEAVRHLYEARKKITDLLKGNQ